MKMRLLTYGLAVALGFVLGAVWVDYQTYLAFRRGLGWG